MFPERGREDEKLDALFQAYRAACPTPGPDANFMPRLWHRIESRKRFTFSFRRMASGFVTAAAALSLALGVYMALPRTPSYGSQSYVEALAEANALDAPDIVGPVHLEFSGR